MAKSTPYDRLDVNAAETYAKLIAQIRAEQEKLSKLKEGSLKGDKVQNQIIEEQKKKIEGLQTRYKSYLDTLKESNDASKIQLDSLTSLSSVVKEMPEMYEHFKEKLTESLSISDKINTSIESIKDPTLKQSALDFNEGLQSGIQAAAELAQLNEEDSLEIKIKGEELRKQLAYLERSFLTIRDSNELTAEQKQNFAESLGELQKMTEEAGKFANQSEEFKEIYGELVEEIGAVGKGFKKIAAGVELFFSNTKNMVALSLFGAAELAHHFAEINKELGVSMTQMVGFKSEIAAASLLLGEGAGEAVIDLAKDLGDIHHLTFEMATDAALMAANYGLSGHEVAFLSTAFGELSGKSYEVGRNTGQYVRDLAMANYVAPSQVMKDIASNTEFFALYSKDGGKNIADAAVAAARLGVGLDTVSKVADHLLDYQSSIQDEMEASVLLGKDLNLGKARELMYQGKIDEGMKAALDAAGGIQAYNKMDYYQRQAIAKSLGVSAAEMQQMIGHQETLNGMHGVGNKLYSQGSEILTAMGNSLTGKILTGMSALVMGAGQLNLGLNAMGTSLLKLLNPIKALGSFIWYLAMGPFRLIGAMMSGIYNKILGSGVATKIWSGFTGGLRKKLGHAWISLMGIGNSIKASIVQTSLWQTVSKGVGMAFNSITSAGKYMLNTMFPGLIAKMTALKAAGSIFGGGAAAGEIGGGAAKGAKAAKNMKNVGKAGKAVGKAAESSSLIGLAAGLTAMGTAAVALGALNLGLAAIGFTLMIPGSIGMLAVGLTAPLAAAGLGVLGTALTAFGATAPVAGIGIALLLGLAGAFTLFGAAVMMIGVGIKSVMAGIGSMITIIPTLTTNMKEITALIIPIFGLAAAITALAVSLITLSAAGVTALPALAVLGFAAGAAGAVFGGGKSKDDEMIELLKSINNKVGGVPAINLDGKKIIEGQNINSGRQGTGQKE